MWLKLFLWMLNNILNGGDPLSAYLVLFLSIKDFFFFSASAVAFFACLASFFALAACWILALVLLRGFGLSVGWSRGYVILRFTGAQTDVASSSSAILFRVLGSVHRLEWDKGLKTGMNNVEGQPTVLIFNFWMSHVFQCNFYTSSSCSFNAMRFSTS